MMPYNYPDPPQLQGHYGIVNPFEENHAMIGQFHPQPGSPYEYTPAMQTQHQWATTADMTLQHYNAATPQEPPFTGGSFEAPEPSGSASPPKKRHRQPYKEHPACDYPGCEHKGPFSRPYSYRRHMREIHGVHIQARVTGSQKHKAVEALASAANDIMESYLATPGITLPGDVRKRTRQDLAQQVGTAIPTDPALMHAEIVRLRKKVNEVYNELRLEKVIGATALAEEKRKAKEREQAMFAQHQEELTWLKRDDHAFVHNRAELVEMRNAMVAQHEAELAAERRRHKDDERRLWNLLTQGKQTVSGAAD